MILFISMFIIGIAGFIIAETEKPSPTLYTTSVSVNNSTTDEPVVGSSCGTVTPGYQNECCINKGYEGWDEENFTCIGENGVDVIEVGDSCVSLPPASRNQCCRNKGYESWNEDANSCLEKRVAGTTNGVDVIEVGDSCVSLPPASRNQCCRNKGYESWNEDANSCLEKRVAGTTNMQGIHAYYSNQSECPEECACSGSTVKCELDNGTRVMTVFAGKSGNVIVQVKNTNMSTNVTLYKSDGKLVGVFNGNVTKEILLPDQIRERIQEHLMERDQKRNRTREINFTDENMTLGEDGYYYIQGKKKARLFWIIPVKEKLQYDIDAETGQIIKTKTRWWGFLARDLLTNASTNNTETDNN